jgi:hypothetical protein
MMGCNLVDDDVSVFRVQPTHTSTNSTDVTLDHIYLIFHFNTYREDQWSTYTTLLHRGLHQIARRRWQTRYPFIFQPTYQQHLTAYDQSIPILVNLITRITQQNPTFKEKCQHLAGTVPLTHWLTHVFTQLLHQEAKHNIRTTLSTLEEIFSDWDSSSMDTLSSDLSDSQDTFSDMDI